MANVEKTASVNGNVYTFKKTEGNKTCTVTIIDTNGNGLDNNDKMVITGDNSVFSAAEIKDFAKGNGYISTDTRKETELKDIEFDSNNNSVKSENGKEYRLGSLIDNSSEKAPTQPTTPTNMTYNTFMNPAAMASSPCMLLAGGYKSIMKGAYNSENPALYAATGWALVSQMFALVTNQQKAAFSNSLATVSTTDTPNNETTTTAPESSPEGTTNSSLPAMTPANIASLKNSEQIENQRMMKEYQKEGTYKQHKKLDELQKQLDNPLIPVQAKAMIQAEMEAVKKQIEHIQKLNEEMEKLNTNLKQWDTKSTPASEKHGGQLNEKDCVIMKGRIKQQIEAKKREWNSYQ